jgi:hypothetical protein
MCENESGITLGNEAYKILVNIILEKKLSHIFKNYRGQSEQFQKWKNCN